MKKKILIFLMIMFITGCTDGNSDYTLEIYPDSIKENVHLMFDNNGYDKLNYLNDIFDFSTTNNNENNISVIEQLKTEDLQATSNGEDLFQKTIKNNQITLSYNYNSTNYKISNIFNTCFNNTYYDSTENYYVIKGYEGFRCLYKDEVKIVIKTDYKVIDSNANEINKNEYVWYINEDNYLENELYIQVSKKQKEILSKNWKMYVLIIGGIIYIVYKIITKENIFLFKKNNEV